MQLIIIKTRSLLL